jgi:PTH1 family peptidyl-tRNA hydrolase
MKYLIVGLGNPGFKYKNTRHNVGFKVLEQLIDSSDVKFSTEKLGDICEFKYKGRTLILLKPSTYMNLSGKAVNYWMQKEKVPLDRVLVILDDIALPFGKLRLKGKGSDAGHNGLKDIAAVLNTTNYSRLKFGVGSEFSKGNQANYVLGQWNLDELSTLKERLKTSTEFIKGFVTIGLDHTMSAWNGK